MRLVDYNTKQKQAILEFLKKSYHSHTTAKDIVEFFGNQEIKIGQATIYRTLDKLEKEGIIKKYVIDGIASACFEYVGDDDCSHEHYHLKCEKCGKFVHFDCDSMKEFNNHLYNHHGFTIDASKTVFYGKCKECNLDVK